MTSMTRYSKLIMMLNCAYLQGVNAKPLLQRLPRLVLQRPPLLQPLLPVVVVVVALRLPALHVLAERLLDLDEAHLALGVAAALVLLLPRGVAALQLPPGGLLHAALERRREHVARLARGQLRGGTLPLPLLLLGALVPRGARRGDEQEEDEASGEVPARYPTQVHLADRGTRTR